LSDPLNFPRWNSAVRAVRKARARESEMGSTYTMERRLPSGDVHNELEVFAREHPTEFGIRTTSGPVDDNFAELKRILETPVPLA
jgi:hypothetical protein